VEEAVMTSSELLVLTAIVDLARSAGRGTDSSIRTRTGLSPETVQRALRKLGEGGYIERRAQTVRHGMLASSVEYIYKPSPRGRKKVEEMEQ
jgi:predicted transcriptional regulator